MKSLITILFITFLSFNSFSQNNYQDVVYLKNGGLIRGTIIELIPDKALKIETSDRSILVFQMGDVEKITKESSPAKPKVNGLTRGYKPMVEIGFILDDDDEPIQKLDLINAYQFNSHFSAGLGIGLRNYVDFSDIMIPVFGDFRVDFLDKKASPYLSLGIGYAISTNDYSKGGFITQPTLGIRVNTSKKVCLNWGIGYYHQKNTHVGFYKYVKDTNSLTLSFGLTFK